MKILYVGVFTNHSTNIGQADSLDKISDLITFDMRDIGSYTLEQRDQAILKIVKEESPDLLLISKGNTINVEVIKKAKEHCKVACWYMDPLVNADNEWMEKVQHSDYIFSAYEKLANLFRDKNKNSFYLQEGFDPNIHRPMKFEKSYDATFVGYLKDHRRDYHASLNFKNFNDSYGVEYTKIVNKSRVNLGFTTNKEGTSDRVYKVLACGQFFLSESWELMENDWEVEKDFVTFNSIQDLDDKIKYFLKNPKERLEIANHGKQTVQKYSTDNWAKRIVETVSA
jgi:spore maturation protein CgeB